MLRSLRLTIILASLFAAASPSLAAEYVIQISVDGLGSAYLQPLIKQNELPTFKRLEAEGAWTDNARADFDYTITLPNHTCMMTGRPVKDKEAGSVSMHGHQWTINVDPKPDATLHSNRGEYVASTFDVVHDHGLRTALFPTKTKFVLFAQSYDRINGGQDKTGADNGRNKIDEYFNQKDSSVMTERFVTLMAKFPCEYSFLHFHDTDTAGHGVGWGTGPYTDALKAIDKHLAQVVQLVETNPQLKGKTTLIVSADHGGRDRNHAANDDPLDYTIPFIVWGDGVDAGKDLYALNADSRHNPGAGRPDYTAPGLPPIRNGDGGNLALSLLSLPPIPGSSINAAQDLRVSAK